MRTVVRLARVRIVDHRGANVRCEQRGTSFGTVRLRRRCVTEVRTMRGENTPEVCNCLENVSGRCAEMEFDTTVGVCSQNHARDRIAVVVCLFVTALMATSVQSGRAWDVTVADPSAAGVGHERRSVRPRERTPAVPAMVSPEPEQTVAERIRQVLTALQRSNTVGGCWAAALHRNPLHPSEIIRVQLEVTAEGRARVSVYGASDPQLAQCIRIRAGAQGYGPGLQIATEARFELVRGG